MDQGLRNKLRGVVTQCRRLLEDSVSQELQGKFGIYAVRKDDVQVDDEARMSHLGDEERAARKDILDHLDHIKARGFKAKEALDQLVREVAFTHLNRLCAYKMMEARQVYVGDQRFREAVSRGVNSNGVKFFLAEHPDDERLFTSGQQDVAYRHFLDWLGGLLSEEIGVLFSPHDPANRLYPPQRVLDEVLALINDEALAGIWAQDETIGWVYQYFTPKELRDQARKESQAPRNSYELAFRNQFFTPRYVVEFLTDNTLGRIWYEMRKGDTKLKDQCRYMVRRPTEVFLSEGSVVPSPSSLEETTDEGQMTQDELLKLPVYVPHRPKKDPRELKILDPACGSGHFLLYCFDLLLTIYVEAYADPDLGPALQRDYPTLDALRRDVPRLILAHNLHGIDIDLRASQIAALAMWLRCQRAYQDMGLKKDRPKITRSNFVCAEPMPGEQSMLKEFVGQIEPKILGQLVEVVFDKMELAGEAGSLLKIEEEISDAVAEAERQFRMGGIKVQQSLFDKTPVSVQLRFDVSGLGTGDFFEQAESRVVDALRSYAQKAHTGQRLQRRLFAEDAVRGFAFVDLCHKRFDVVLMNPPFGSGVESTTQLLKAQYTDSKNDLYACFIERGRALATEGGLLGAITSRVGFFASTLRKWRERLLLGDEAVVSVVADLGHGVLDAALVEAAAYVLQPPAHSTSDPVFISALDAADKGAALLSILVARPSENRFFTPILRSLKALPGCPIAYWLPHELEASLVNMKPLSTQGAKAAVGLQTDDDFRFLRLYWEVDPSFIGRQKKWVPMSKGGEYSPFYDDIHLLLLWENDGAEIKRFVEEHYSQWSRSVRNVDLYFSAGLTYPERTTSDFSPRPLPVGSVFSIAGPSIIFDDPSQRLAFLGFAYSRVCKLLLEIFIGLGDAVESGSAARHYRTGILNDLPIPENLADNEVCLSASKCLHSATKRATEREEAIEFRLPALAKSSKLSLTEGCQQWLNDAEDAGLTMLDSSLDLDRLFAGKYGLDGDAHQILVDQVAHHPCEYNHIDVDEEVFAEAYLLSTDQLVDAVTSTSTSRHFTKKSYYADRHIELLCHRFQVHPRSIVALRRKLRLLRPSDLQGYVLSALSYCVGVAVGRWDVRLIDGAPHEAIADPFAELPRVSPAALVGGNGLPLLAPNHPLEYPASVVWDGVFVDDAEHTSDIVRRVQNVFEVIWKERAEAVEKEACEILGLKDLRDYFRRPGKGGFWDDHMSRYSKSRRKAPIYWLLQSSKKNYAIWLYYHRLDKDLLFKALVNYVEPKIRLEDSRLETLRTQKAAAGDSGREAKRLGKDVERQEEFLSELRDFEDKLRRAANLHLEPDLNDGVVLNIAPLHELVPWKEAKTYWQELLDGQYEWSSIAKQLRERGLVQ